MLQEKVMAKMEGRLKKKVLVVDDSPSIRELMKIILEGLGFKSIYFTWDGYSSLEIFQREKPDVTFLDMNLPTMTGLETLKIMFTINPSAKIILTTAFPKTDKNVLDAISQGATYYLEKPLDRKKISDIVERIEREETGPEKSKMKMYLEKIEEVQSKLSEKTSYLVFDFDTSEEFNEFSTNLSNVRNVSVKSIQFYKGKFLVTVEILPVDIDMIL